MSITSSKAFTVWLLKTSEGILSTSFGAWLYAEVLWVEQNDLKENKE